ncbi:MAG: phosphoenolpyruvate--protein phosphotransferase [Candidatus Firestonebacteria bacterium RIFOXYC2_FULL_39_67]|nr:MAG: phosphoenolpyruvate--protein phosphotransferase [Candidatus Firestonebacteria bacterium RIFOXYD2_FULL_39_29]OGF52826.1 MAG: phosphoenolpyruvate--protein phosphotransferase [Candidatus Firestonebacteria bacterium RifOxyC12_full_39_7]OGF57426.1 MAG: phosphoenolpyruvate--protein phosphotransferase [Candidatus Firestonebacteria bacterium RIFOXYC2_FULL_39_67]
MRKVYKGIAVSSGVVIGRALVLPDQEMLVIKKVVSEDKITEEVIRFNAALEKTRVEIKAMHSKVKKEIGGKHSNIFEAHLMILGDPMLTTDVEKHIKSEKLSAESVFSRSVNNLVESFEKIEDEYLKERANDVRDIGRRVFKNLTGSTRETLADIKEEVILFARDLSPSDTVTMKREKVKGFCTDLGGKTSHTAIIARALEIPAVVGVQNISQNVSDGDLVVVDGSLGVIIVNPNEEDLKHYNRKREDLIKQNAKLSKLRELPAETLDGYKIELSANIEIEDEAKLVVKHGAIGVGLFRTEFLFLNRLDLPNEEEQFASYFRAAEFLYPNSVIIRTLDLGGDKFLSHLGLSKEENPFLGLRAIRLCLARPELFKPQLRAILRASELKNVKIMFPMISGIEEFLKAKEMLEQAKNDLRKEKKSFDNEIDLGVMIEIPSASLTADILAKEVDFFSIGSNDLIQYTLAIDRVNTNMAHMYNPLHPSILRQLKRIVTSAHKEGKWVGMCGEMASDTAFSALLIGLGIDELSTAPVAVPEVKKVLRSITMSEAKKIAAEALSFRTLDEVKLYMNTVNKGSCKYCK